MESRVTVSIPLTARVTSSRELAILTDNTVCATVVDVGESTGVVDAVNGVVVCVGRQLSTTISRLAIRGTLIRILLLFLYTSVSCLGFYSL